MSELNTKPQTERCNFLGCQDKADVIINGRKHCHKHARTHLRAGLMAKPQTESAKAYAERMRLTHRSIFENN